MNRLILPLIYFCLLFLKAQSQTIDFKADTTKGCGVLDVTFTNTSTSLVGNENWAWTFGYKEQSSKEKNPKTVKYDTAGVFTVTLTARDTDLQLLGTKSIQIKVRPKLNAYFKYRDTISDRKFIFKSVQGSDSAGIKYKYRWDIKTKNNLNISALRDTIPIILKTFDNEGIYIVRLKISDNLGCADSVSQTVSVVDGLKAPNVFTPNNDGINDFFSIVTKSNSVYAFHVFNRNGQMVFKSEAPTIIWDGTNFTGDPLDSGTYFFTVETTKGELPSKLSGFIILTK